MAAKLLVGLTWPCRELARKTSDLVADISKIPIGSVTHTKKSPRGKIARVAAIESKPPDVFLVTRLGNVTDIPNTFVGESQSAMHVQARGQEPILFSLRLSGSWQTMGMMAIRSTAIPRFSTSSETFTTSL